MFWISIHAPHAGSDNQEQYRLYQRHDFNPRSPCGERRTLFALYVDDLVFQSTLPMRGATTSKRYMPVALSFQSTLPMRGATKTSTTRERQHLFQSTLPMRGATQTRCNTRNDASFQSTLPMRGATHLPQLLTFPVFRFQSTLPMRGATDADALAYIQQLISIHAPHAGSDRFNLGLDRKMTISIHAPHAGSDFRRICRRPLQYLFQSTLPMRGATQRGEHNILCDLISIHAPHAGSD